MTVQEILQNIVWKEETTGLDGATEMGILKDLFPTADMLVVKHSKRGAERASIMIKKDGKLHTVICSPRVTQLLRADKITKEHLVGFNVLHNTKQNSLYLTLPSDGWVEIRKISIKQYIPVAINPADAIA